MQDIKLISVQNVFVKALFNISSSIILSFLLVSSSRAQTITKNSPKFLIYKPKQSAVFQGKISGKQYDGDSLDIMFNRDIIAIPYDSEDSFTNSLRFRMKTDENGRFKFKIPDVDHPGKLVINIYRKNISLEVNQNYIVEPGDSIFFDIKKENDTLITKVSGKGFEKYEASDLLYADMFNRGKHYYIYKLQNESDSVHLVKLYKSIENLNREDLAILKKYERHLNPVVFQLMKAEIQFGTSLTWNDHIWDDYISSLKDSVAKKQIRNVYHKYTFSLDFNHSDILLLSDLWTHLVVENIRTDLTIQLERRPDIVEVYEDIYEHYSGLLREKLLTKLILDPGIVNIGGMPSTSAQIQNLIVKTYKLTKTDNIKSYLASQFVLNKGSNAFNFELKDLSGKKVKLSDLLGKVILIDCWYNGCTGCAQFYRIFTDSVYPEIRNDTSFIALSISCNDQFPTWLKGVKSGKYTDEHHVNLSFGKDGFHHPMLIYYRVTMFPFVIIIDKKGKIFADLRMPSNVAETRQQLFDALKSN